MDAERAPPQPPAAFRFAVGDELGIVKVIEVPAGPKWDAAAVVSQWGSADKSLSVQCLACSTSMLCSGAPALVAVGRKGGRVDLVDAFSGQQQCSLSVATKAQHPSSKGSTGAVIGLEFVTTNSSRPLQLVVGTADGNISICSSSSSDSSADAGAPEGPGCSWAVRQHFSVGPSLICMAMDSTGTHVVVGGEGTQPSIWELSTGSKVWQAKGGKPNRIRLVDKPFTTALAFLPSSQPLSSNGHAMQPQAAPLQLNTQGTQADDSSSSSIERKFIAGTAAAKLLVYDTAAGKRPQQEIVFGESRVTTLAVEPGGLRVWAANGTGHMQLLLLSANKLQDSLKGSGGSIRTLQLHPGGEPLVASVGLDRFLRVHDTTTRASKGRVYLKQHLTSVVWLPVQQQHHTQNDTAAAAEVVPAAVQQGAAAEGVSRSAGGSKVKKSGKVKKKRSKDTEGGNVGEGAAAEGTTLLSKRRKHRQQ